MKSGVPWSIRGIDDEIREAARRAARRSGLTVSEWLNDLIARQAAAEGVAPAPPYDDDDDDGDAETGAVADAVRHLTRRIRAMDESSRAGLSGLQDRLDEIEMRLGGVAASRRRGGARARSLSGVASVVHELSREIDNADETARSTVEGLRDRIARPADREAGVDRVAEAIHKLDARIASMSEQMKPPASDEPTATLDTIKARLDELLAGKPEPPPTRAVVLDATLRSLETHIDQARSRFSAATERQPAASMTASDEERVRRIESRLAEIVGAIEASRNAAPSSAGDDLDSTLAEISARQRTIDEGADHTPPARPQRQTVDAPSSLRRDVSSPAGKAASGLSLDLALARLDFLAEEVAAVHRALEADDSPRAIARLEMRVAELARGIEAVLNVANAASHGGEGEAGSRLETRLDEIATRIEGFVGGAASPVSLVRVSQRFSELADRLEHLTGTRLAAPAALDEIKSEIFAIRSDIAGRVPPNVDHLEAEVAELASRLESVTRSESEGQALAELESQVAHIAAELERSTPRTATLKQVEESLARLQYHLSDNRQESVEAARAAARDAVREMTAAQGDSDLVQALKGDLENIRAATGDADQRTQRTLGSVHETLTRVVERLSRLERESVEADAATAREPARATGTYGAQPSPPRTDTGSAAAAWANTAPKSLPEDNRPLEPGSGKPDLAALRELARSAAEAHRERRSDRKTDFIAAARRAAQAAAAEAASGATEEVEESRPGTFARIGQAIRKRRRPLLLAAAALVLAISAIHLFGERAARSIGLSPDVATVNPITGEAPRVETAPAEATASPGEQSLVAPPPDAQSEIAFARPESFANRFGDGPAAPPASTFEPRATSPDGSTEVAEHGDMPWSVAPGVEAGLDPAIGPQELRDAAAAGDPVAAFEVAVRHAEGNGVAPDLAKAAEWYRRAAGAGIAVAQYRLGSLYERGQAVERNLTTAAIWYQRAADQGHVGAMHNLAVMMSEGVDGPPDHAKAFDWFLAAANYGVTDSQYNLGVIYARGLGAVQDFVESYKWFAIAAAAGDADGGVRRDEIAKVLSPDDLAGARAAVHGWRATQVIPEANTVATPPGGWGAAPIAISEADRRALVKKIQVLLADHGYDPGPADGFEGPKTREALRAFQRKSGLSETGEISGEVVAALTSPQT